MSVYLNYCSSFEFVAKSAVCMIGGKWNKLNDTIGQQNASFGERIRMRFEKK